MQRIQTVRPELRLVGIKCRTNNAAERDLASAKIAATLQKYFQSGVPERITDRRNPHTTYCVYTEYDNDHNGDYTYFVGEESAATSIPDGMFECIIPAQKYVKFTNGPGSMPDVCISVWQKIWTMTPEDFGAPRSFQADFEVYDARAIDYTNTTLDVYVGIAN